MKFQRFLILVFAAALTAGTSSAISVQFATYVSGTGNQSGSLLIDGFTLGQYSSSNPVGAVIYTTVDESNGWHSIAIDYNSISGTNYLLFTVNGDGGLPFASYDASGTTISGLTGDYFVGGVHQFTKYGEGPLYDGSIGGIEHYNGAVGLWGGTYTTTSSFEEVLTGYIYLGAGTPSLNDVPASQPPPPPPTDPPPTDGGGAAPEPAGWWLAAAALPLMLFSKLRLNRAKVRP